MPNLNDECMKLLPMKAYLTSALASAKNLAHYPYKVQIFPRISQKSVIQCLWSFNI